MSLFRAYPAVCLAVLVAGVLGCAEPKPSPPPEESAEAQPADTSGIFFADVTAEAGLDGFRHVADKSDRKWFPEMMGSGCAFIDYDGDGWQDVLLVGGGHWPDHEGDPQQALWLYRNNGDGTFSHVTDEAGLGGLTAYGFGVAAADYDNDGHQDLYFTTLHENMLFQNNGDGTFTEVTEAAGLEERDEWSTSAIFFDADRDGHLDLYVGNYVEWSPQQDIWCSLDGESKAYCTPEEYNGVPGRFYRNNGDGTFSDQTEAAGFIDSPGKTLGIAELDYNDDGWPDLVVANDTQRDLLYENNGDGTFTEKGMLSGIAYDENGRARAGMGVDVGVVDQTGEPTFFVGNFSNEMIGVYRHINNGIFADRAAISKIGRPSLLTLTFGLFLFDVDYDGDLDLFAANGHVQEDIAAIQDGVSFPQPPQLFINRGDGTFREAETGASNALAQAIVARGAASADFDHDGDIDILIAENNGPAHLWRNELVERSTSSPNYLRVSVRGSESNLDGLGTSLVAVADGQRMHRRVRTGSSYLSQSELTATFGLGDADHVDSLYVQWLSGQEQVFTNVAPNRTIRVTEGQEQVQTVPFEQGPVAQRLSD